MGVLILGRKRPGFDQEWNKMICSRSVAAMQSLGLKCIGQDAPVIDDQTFARRSRAFTPPAATAW